MSGSSGSSFGWLTVKAIVLWLGLATAVGTPIYQLGIVLGVPSGAVFQGAIAAGGTLASIITTVYLKENR